MIIGNNSRTRILSGLGFELEKKTIFDSQLFSLKKHGNFCQKINHPFGLFLARFAQVWASESLPNKSVVTVMLP